jgi:hypothetical protein
VGYLLSMFIVVLLLTFALSTLIAGIFTAYFGAGKSRKIGIALAVLGVLIGAATYIAYYGPLMPDSGKENFLNFIIPPIVAIIAAIVGAGVALLAFIGAIMKA